MQFEIHHFVLRYVILSVLSERNYVDDEIQSVLYDGVVQLHF
jgi:hypothetical protein